MWVVTAGPTSRRWVATRVAHPTRDLDRSAAFYRDLLGLHPRGGFTGHDGYDGVFFALPGGGELEITAGPAEPRPGTDEDLLVLYLPTLEEVRQAAAELEAAGAPTVPAANPYWNRWGQVFLDPDGYAVVIAAAPPDPDTAGEVRVETHVGPREELRGLSDRAGGWTVNQQRTHGTRLERVLGVPLADDAVRQWPQSGEMVDGRACIAEVESHFEGLRLGVGRRVQLGDLVVVEWSTDYGDGRIYRNVSIAELEDGKAVRVTDYWGEPFTPPPWRERLTQPLSMPRGGPWPASNDLSPD